MLLSTIPGAGYEDGHPLQALVTNLDASPYVGRLAIAACCTARSGRAPRSRAAPTGASSAPVTELYVTEALDRVDADDAGRDVAVAGLPEVTIGETLADPDDPACSRWSRSTSRACR